ncbi:MAG: hypothetical protein N2C14_23605, partial [Planctomycetales bacterium]
GVFFRAAFSFPRSHCFRNCRMESDLRRELGVGSEVESGSKIRLLALSRWSFAPRSFLLPVLSREKSSDPRNFSPRRLVQPER